MIIVFFILSLASYASLASYVRVTLWKCLPFYLIFACIEVVFRYAVAPFGLPEAIIILIEECIKAGTALVMLSRKDGLSLVAIAAFGFAEMGIIKPLMILDSGEAYQSIVYNNMVFASLLYLNASLMHGITATILANMRRPLFIILAVIPNALLHFIFNITRDLYASLPQAYSLNTAALALETFSLALIILLGLRRYRAALSGDLATVSANYGSAIPK